MKKSQKKLKKEPISCEKSASKVHLVYRRGKRSIKKRVLGVEVISIYDTGLCQIKLNIMHKEHHVSWSLTFSPEKTREIRLYERWCFYGKKQCKVKEV